MMHGAWDGYRLFHAIFYSSSSLVVIAVAGMAFGNDAAQGAIADELGGLMGRDTAEATQAMVRSASDRLTGTWATVIGLVTILIAITGVFGEMQSALNKVWKVSPPDSTMSRLVRARLASLGLVIAFGFVLTVSLTISAALTALTTFLHGVFPLLEVALGGLDFVVSLILVAAMFAAMYKVLPDAAIAWRDVVIGALVATVLFGAGKYVIALYIGNSNCFELWCRRGTDRSVTLDLLFVPDFFAGRRVHARVGSGMGQPQSRHAAEAG